MLLSNHREIKTMQLIGAKDGFIKKPYLTSILSMTYMAFILNFIIIVMLFGWIYLIWPELLSFVNWIYVLIALLLVLVFSVVISRISTVNILNKLLRDSFKGN